MKKPKRIDLDLDQVDALLKRVETGTLQDGDYQIIKAMVETIHLLSQCVDEKAASIRRLLRMLFGERTEKLENVIKNKEKDKSSTPKDSSGNGTDKNHKPRPKGHGRNAAAEYTGAEQIKVPHTTLKIGDNCPGCLKGKLYEMKVPKLIVRVTGKPPLPAKVYQMQKLRCNLCGDIFTAKAPEGIGEEKYDAASGAMIALLKYGSGLPFNRLQQLQGSCGVPLPASTQWEIVEQVADRIYPVYLEFNRQAAQGNVIYNDDTTQQVSGFCEKKISVIRPSAEKWILSFHAGKKDGTSNILRVTIKLTDGTIL